MATADPKPGNSDGSSENNEPLPVDEESLESKIQSIDWDDPQSVTECLKTLIDKRSDVKRLISLLGKPSDDEITDLLSYTPSGSEERLIHCSDRNLIPLVLHLIEHITNKNRYRLLVEMEDSKYNLNTFGCAIMKDNIKLARDIYRRLGKDNQLLAQPSVTENGLSVLHTLASKNMSVTNLLSVISPCKWEHWLSLVDHEGRTVLSKSISENSPETYNSILKLHSDTKYSRDDFSDSLLRLCVIPDIYGKTAYHYAAQLKSSDLLIDLLESTCYTLTAPIDAITKILVDILESETNTDIPKKKRTKISGTVTEETVTIHQENRLVVSYTLDALQKDKYWMRNDPNVLIFYTTRDRPGADLEANTLIRCFEEMGMSVDSYNDFTKRMLFRVIQLCQGRSSSSGLIVALLSHGVAGCISDSHGQLIPFVDIERAMTSSHKRIPKLMIVQSCLRGKHFEDHSVLTELNCTASQHFLAGIDASHDRLNHGVPQIYRPYSANLCAIMSTAPGCYSERSLFINHLADVLSTMPPDRCISTAMKEVNRLVYQNKQIPDQVPGCLHNLLHDFCIKSSLPAYLLRNRDSSTVPPSIQVDGVGGDNDDDSAQEHIGQACAETCGGSISTNESQGPGETSVSGNVMSTSTIEPANQHEEIESLPDPPPEPLETLQYLCSPGDTSVLETVQDFSNHKHSWNVCRGRMDAFLQDLKMYLDNDCDPCYLLTEIEEEMKSLKGKTTFEFAADRPEEIYLRPLLEACCQCASEETRKGLLDILLRPCPKPVERKNRYICYPSIAEAHPRNKLIYSWALDSLSHNRFMLFGQPSVVIMYSKGGKAGLQIRMNADQEANGLKRCLEGLGLRDVHIDSDFKEQKILAAIRKSEENRRNGQIVFLLGHGVNGCVIDDGARKIPFSLIEEVMTGEKDKKGKLKYQGTPKLLIIEACQDSLANNPNSYVPKSPDLSVVLSSGPGNSSRQGVFIGMLRKTLDEHKGVGNITEAIEATINKVEEVHSGQQPVLLSRLTYSLCIKGILPIFLEDERWRCQCFI